MSNKFKQSILNDCIVKNGKCMRKGSIESCGLCGLEHTRTNSISKYSNTTLRKANYFKYNRNK